MAGARSGDLLGPLVVVHSVAWDGHTTRAQMGELSMYKITRISAADADRGRRLALAGHRYEGLRYIREHIEVLGEFDSYMEARQCWRALGLTPGADYHATDGVIYRMGVARTD